MKTSMYLVKVRDNWYQLRYTPDHSVLGCGPDLQTLLNTAHRYVVTYCKRHIMDRAVSKLQYKWKLSEQEQLRRDFEYAHRDEELEELLQNTIEEAIKEVLQNTPMKKVKSRLKVNRFINTYVPPKEEVTETKRIGLSKIFRKKDLVTV